jgi:hypothetical protein
VTLLRNEIQHELSAIANEIFQPFAFKIEPVLNPFYFFPLVFRKPLFLPGRDVARRALSRDQLLI